MSNLEKSQEFGQLSNLAIKQPNNVEKAVFSTIAYYDYFNYPLTAGEIWQYLIKINPNDQIPMTNEIPNFKTQINTKNITQKLKPSLFEIINILDNNEKLEKVIDQKDGFYFLNGREEMIKQRIQKKKLADWKFKKSKWILKFISYLPFVRLVMMSGSMGLGNPYKDSDIDLLVVAKTGRIWTARAIVTFFALVLGKYRHTGKTANRLCFNHYITEQSLSIDFGNLYKAEEYLNLIPLAGDMEIYGNFLAANKGWMEDYVLADHLEVELPSELGSSTSKLYANNLRIFLLGGIFLKFKNFFEFLLFGIVGDRFEKNFKKLQIYFIEKNPLTKSPRARIRYNDENLVFHPVLIELEVIGKWKEKMREFIA